jgi:hypothetical protein
MVVYVYDVSAAELAQLEGGLTTSGHEWIELESYHWGIGR